MQWIFTILKRSEPGPGLLSNRTPYPNGNHKPLKEQNMSVKISYARTFFYQKSKLPLLAFHLAASQEDDLAVRRLARQRKSYPTRGCGTLEIVPEIDDWINVKYNQCFPKIPQVTKKKWSCEIGTTTALASQNRNLFRFQICFRFCTNFLLLKKTVLNIVWIQNRSRNMNRNFLKVGNGTAINHYDSTTLEKGYPVQHWA